MMWRSAVLLLSATAFIYSEAFVPSPGFASERKAPASRPSSSVVFTPIKCRQGAAPTYITALRSSTGEYAVPSDDEEEEEVEPGKMRVSEIKAELDMREIDYSDCFDKESLAERLEEARATGKANPEILDKFNRQKIESQFKEEKLEIDDEDLERAVANDGTLPGGMKPEQFKTLVSNPEIMSLLQSTKMQEAMKLMMTGGREELEEKLKEDPELQETVRKLDTIMQSIQ